VFVDASMIEPRGAIEEWAQCGDSFRSCHL
jgi:hypothetical protein